LDEVNEWTAPRKPGRLPELVRSKFSVPRFSALTHQIDDEKERSGVVDLESSDLRDSVRSTSAPLSDCAPEKRAALLHVKGCQVMGARTAEGRER
jgi:hypothetical protein